MIPDYENAALQATRILIRYGIHSAPVSPLPILKDYPGVLVISYDSLSDKMHQDRRNLIFSIGDKNQDAFTTVSVRDGKQYYIVTYNQHLSQVLVQRALARELGHIVLGHDGTRPEDVRNEEAVFFAHHLLCPRALLYAVQASDIRVTTEVFGTLTGCFDTCLSCMRRMPGAHVPADLNRAVRNLFFPYFLNFFEYQRSIMHKDVSALADFGTFMDGYIE